MKIAVAFLALLLGAVNSPGGEIADDVADQLPRAVPGEVPAARHLEDLDSEPSQGRGVGPQASPVPAPPHGEHRRVVGIEQPVGGGALGTRPHQAFLKGEAVAIGGGAQVGDRERRHA